MKLTDDIGALAEMIRTNRDAFDETVLEQLEVEGLKILAADKYNRRLAARSGAAQFAAPTAGAAPVVNVYPAIHVPAQPAPTVNVTAPMGEVVDAIRAPRTREIERDARGEIAKIRDKAG